MSAQPDARKTCRSPAESYFRAGQGPKLSAALGDKLATALTAADSLAADFANFSGKDLASRLSARRGGDQAIFVQLSDRWPEANIRKAAWRDLADACRDEATVTRRSPSAVTCSGTRSGRVTMGPIR